MASLANEGSTVQLSALVSFRIGHPGLSTTFIIFIRIQWSNIPRETIYRYTCATRDLAGKPKSIHRVSESQFLFHITTSSSSTGSLHCLEWLSVLSLLIHSSYQHICVAGVWYWVKKNLCLRIWVLPLKSILHVFDSLNYGGACEIDCNSKHNFHDRKNQWRETKDSEQKWKVGLNRMKGLHNQMWIMH